MLLYVLCCVVLCAKHIIVSNPTDIILGWFGLRLSAKSVRTLIFATSSRSSYIRSEPSWKKKLTASKLVLYVFLLISTRLTRFLIYRRPSNSLFGPDLDILESLSNQDPSPSQTSIHRGILLECVENNRSLQCNMSVCLAQD
jgi:hypothetical protein